MTPRPDPIVLDSSVLVAYERVRADDGGVLRAAQARVAAWLQQNILLLVPAQSLAIASSWCGGKLPELDFLLRGDPDQVLVVPLGWDAAVQVGAASAPPPAGQDLETAHVVWCATGHTDGARPPPGGSRPTHLTSTPARASRSSSCRRLAHTCSNPTGECWHR